MRIEEKKIIWKTPYFLKTLVMQDENNTTIILFLGSLKVFLVLKPPIHERNWKKEVIKTYMYSKNILPSIKLSMTFETST